eukprot:9001646-Pyramimonas_sp.AAC.1
MVEPLMTAICTAFAGYRSSLLINPGNGWTENVLQWTMVLSWRGTGKSPTMRTLIKSVEYACQKAEKDLNEELKSKHQDEGTTASPSSGSSASHAKPASVVVFDLQQSSTSVTFEALNDEFGQFFHSFNVYKQSGTDRDDVNKWKDRSSWSR